jgi:PAS domain S-box-containing protein
MVSYLTVIYAMLAGMALTIGAVHLIIWGGNRQRKAYLFSAGMALAACVQALVEMLIALTSVPEHMGNLIRWGNFSVGITLLCMVWFVRMYLSAGRSWLLWSITGLWALGLVINFSSPTGLTFTEIYAVERLNTLWGEPLHQVVGTTNPWKFLADLASLLITIFVIDASRTAWRRGSRHAAAVIGGSITFFIVVAGIHTPLVDAGIFRTPTIISAAFLAILAAMSYEIARDVSRSRALLEKVHGGQLRLQSMFETVRLLVLDIDSEGIVCYANPFFLNWRALKLEEVIGRPATDFIVPRIFNPIFEGMRQKADFHTPLEARWNAQDRNGEDRQLALTALRMDNSESRFAGVLCVAADITQELETNRTLARTRLQLDRLMRSNLLGEFASSLAHELNQPLAAILANAQVARRYLTQDPLKLDQALEVIDGIVQDDRRAAALIKQLRALVHHDEVRRENLDLTRVLDDTLALLTREFENQEIKLELDCPPSDLFIQACRIEIQQVLLNLILNAVQALEDWPIEQRRISIRVSSRNQTVQVNIQDAGPGLPAEELESVFSAFHTGNNGNMGLGLTICRRIIEAHGGSISAANGHGHGAVFSFSLPLQTKERLGHDGSA